MKTIFKFLYWFAKIYNMTFKFQKKTKETTIEMAHKSIPEQKFKNSTHEYKNWIESKSKQPTKTIQSLEKKDQGKRDDWNPSSHSICKNRWISIEWRKKKKRKEKPYQRRDKEEKEKKKNLKSDRLISSQTKEVSYPVPRPFITDHFHFTLVLQRLPSKKNEGKEGGGRGGEETRLDVHSGRFHFRESTKSFGGTRTAAKKEREKKVMGIKKKGGGRKKKRRVGKRWKEDEPQGVAREKGRETDRLALYRGYDLISAAAAGLSKPPLPPSSFGSTCKSFKVWLLVKPPRDRLIFWWTVSVRGSRSTETRVNICFDNYVAL